MFLLLVGKFSGGSGGGQKGHLPPPVAQAKNYNIFIIYFYIFKKIFFNLWEFSQVSNNESIVKRNHV